MAILGVSFTIVHGFCTGGTWGVYSEYMDHVLRVQGLCTVDEGLGMRW